MLWTFLVSIAILAFVMYFVIPWIPNLAGKFEILFVNSLHLPFQSDHFLFPPAHGTYHLGTLLYP